MSAFEDFVQNELPKRGYLNSDVAQETIIVRRGVGPRQFDAVQLAEGEVLGLVGGTLAGVAQSSLTTRKFVYSFINETTVEVVHNLNSENVIIQAFDVDKYVVLPNSMRIVDADTVEVSFNTPISGVIRVIFLD